jgi:hypothetical protein
MRTAAIALQLGALVLLAAATVGAQGAVEPSAGVSMPAASSRAGLPATLPVKREAVLTPDTAALNPAIAVLSIAGAAGGFWLWRRGAARSLGRQLGMRRQGAAPVRISSQALTPHASVHAVKWRGEEYLVACTSQHVTLLSRKAAGDGEEASS